MRLNRSKDRIRRGLRLGLAPDVAYLLRLPGVFAEAQVAIGYCEWMIPFCRASVAEGMRLS
ncbi:hypothetical protein SQ03_12280 [Methylobacterium platani JCM 14648]|uniref:Uncharacterized protein n=2 Tax=Methylobacterium platani TaxID=427683 RepID=A0A179S228_9HYPH|nr:hypothetical protein SQ03_12280 [Methylobacterium platani JCM 14648]OAS18183.1 hypothetical protein A5481_26935 [Methylobacterium platani]